MWSATPHRGGKITKSAMATPGRVDLAVSTVKIDGSYRKIVRIKREGVRACS